MLQRPLQKRSRPLIKASSLKSYTAKDLAQMAKREGVSGWHSMRKEQLIKALSDLEKKSARPKKSSHKGSNGAKSTNGAKASNGEKSRSPRSAKKAVAKPVAKKTPRRLKQAHKAAGQRKDISSPATSADSSDRLVLMVRDAYWLHAYWEINSRAVIRAKAAMAEQWHTARPVLRLLKSVSRGSASSAEVVERDIEIHGEVNNWYIDVSEPPQTYRTEIGYLDSNGKFFGVARSNSVTTPKSNSTDLVDENWKDLAVNCDKILAQSGAYSTEGNDGELQKLFEERLRRPMGSPMITRYGCGAEAILEKDREFAFSVDAEMIVFGSTQADAHVMLGGEPVKVRPDGTFTVRMSMTEGRQVLPVVSSSSDGVQQQTIILAVERNTKTMEPVAREST